MAKFVLTAQLQLQAPTNVQQVVSQIQNQLNNVNVNVQVQGSARANQQIQQLTQSTQNATTAADRMGRAFAVSIRRFAAFSIATRAVGLFTSTLADAVRTAIDFERELIKISQVTGRSVSNLRDLTDSVTNLSTGLGVTSQSLLEVTTVLTQAGLSADDTKIALESLAKAALAPNFDSIQETAEGAIAILAQFKQGVGALEGQLSSIDAVAGAFAVEAGDLIDVIRRAGGVFKSSGGSLNELLALFTSVRATTRESAESIGTGLRTIFTRIQRPETIEFLRQFGVELVDLNGKFVGPYEAIRRLSEALSGLGEGDLTFISIAEELGGFRQIGKVLPLLQQFSTAQSALNVAQNAGNGLTKNAETAQLALAVRIVKVREEFLALVRSMTETPTFQIMANAALSLASALIKIADSIKPLLPLLGAVAAFKAVKGIGSFIGGIGAGLTSSRTFNQGGKVHAFATGGLVPGSGNRDTVPAMLTPGEFVIRKSSVAKLGSDNLKQMNAGGSASRFAIGGKASRKVDYEKGVGSSPFASAKSNKLGQEAYALQKSSGLSQFEFDDAKRFADANGYNLQQFKTLIAKRAQDKKNKAGLKTNTSDLLSTLRGEPTQATERQTSLARQLSGPEAAAQPKALSPEAEKLRVMLGGTPRKFAAGGIIALRPFDKDTPDSPKRLSGSITREMVISKAGIKGKNYISRFSEVAAQSPNSDLKELATKKSIKIDAIGISIGDKSVAENTEQQIKDKFASIINTSSGALAAKLQTEAPKKSITSSDLELFGINGVIGNAFEAMLTTLGAPFDSPPQDEMQKAINKANNNSAFDYPTGLGSLGGPSFSALSNIPTDAKRTLTTKNLQEVITKKYPNLLADAYKDIAIQSQGKQFNNLDPNKTYSLQELGLTKESALKAGFTNPFRGKWQAPVARHFGGLIQKFAKGGIANAPLIDDIENATNTILPRPSLAIARLLQAGGGAVDVDRTIKRTIGDKAFGSAKTDSQREAALQTYFRDDAARLRDVKTAPLTQFGQELQSVIKSGKLDGRKVSIISKSKRVPGVAEYLSQLFGIPAANMAFTSGQSKEPAMQAIRTKGPRVDRVKKFFGGIISQQFAVGGKADPKDTLETYFKDSSPINLGLSNSRSLGADQRKQLASQVRDMRKLRTQAPSELYSSISRNAFDKFASDVGLDKTPNIPEGTKLFDQAKYYAASVSKIVGRSFSLPGFVSTSKDFPKAKSFLDNAPRAKDRWAAMLTILTKKNAQGIDVAEQLKGRSINATKQDINPRTGKMETFVMNPPSSENEVVLSPRSRFRVNSAKFVDLMGNKNVWATAQQFAGGGLVPGVGNSDTVPATLQQGDFVIRKSSVGKLGIENLASMAGYATGGNVDKSVPALLTPGEFVFSKDQAQSIGYGNLNRMNKVGKFAKGGVVQRFAAGTATGGAKPIISNIPIPGFDTKAPTLLNQIIGKLTGTFTVTELTYKEALPKFKSMQKLMPDLTTGIIEYHKAMGLAKRQMGPLVDAYYNLVNKLYLSGAKDDEIIAAMQPYLAALKADTNAKLQAASATNAASVASIPPAVSSGGSPTFISGPMGAPGSIPGMSNVSGGSASSARSTSANTSAIDINTKAQQNAASTALAVADNNKMFAASMAISLLQGFLPAIDENSSALLQMSQGALSLLSSIATAGFALEAFGVKLAASDLTSISRLSNQIGLVFDSVGKAGLSLIGIKTNEAAAATATAAASSASAVANQAEASASAAAAQADTVQSSQASALGKNLGAFTIGLGAAYLAVSTFSNAQRKSLEQTKQRAIDRGDVEVAGKAGANSAGLDFIENFQNAGMLLGGAVGGFFGSATGPVGTAAGSFAGGTAGAAIGRYVGNQLIGEDTLNAGRSDAQSAAQFVKTSKILENSATSTKDALDSLAAGTISAKDALNQMTPATGSVIDAIKMSRQANLDAEKSAQNAGYSTLREFGANVTMGYVDSNAERKDKIKSQNEARSAESQKLARQQLSNIQPALNQQMSEIASSGGDFDDFLSSLNETEFELLNLTDGAIRSSALSFENLSKEIQRAQKAFSAMNLGMQNVQGAAAAAALGVNNYVAAQQSGNIGLEQSLAVLEASVTSAAQGISNADFGKALSDASEVLYEFGANPEQVTKFQRNISSVNEVQKNQSSIFGGAKEKLAENIRNSSGAKGRQEAFTKAIEEQLSAAGYDDATIKRFKEASANMSDDQLKEIGKGNFAAFEESINELGKKTLEQVNGPLKAAIEIQKQLNELTKQRVDAEKQLISAQLEASNIRMEAADIIAQYGGPKVTPAMRQQNIVEQANISAQGIRGVNDLKSGSATDIANRTNQLRDRQNEILNIRTRAAQGDADAQKQLQGESGTNLQAEEQRIADATKAQIQATRDLIKSKQEELKIIKEKNQLEKSSIDALVSGDIEKFFDQQAAVGAQAAVATGDQRLIGQFGMSAIGAAAQETRRQQEAGVQELYGQKLAGPGGLTERTYGSAISAAGVQNPLAMAQVAAGTTAAEASVEQDIRGLAGTLPAQADIQVDAASTQLQAAEIQLEAARAKGQEAVAQMQGRQFALGGVVYASAGKLINFQPKGTDTVPAMLTPGEFVVRREAVQRGNNLSILKAINRGSSPSASSSISQSNQMTAMSSGGMVRYFNRGGMTDESGTGGGGMGITSQTLSSFTEALTKFNTDLNANIEKLQNTSFNITLNPTNVNVNLMGGSFLETLTQSIQEKLMSYIGQEISNYSVGNDGKLRKSGSTLNQ